MAPVSTVLVWYILAEGDPLFAPVLEYLRMCFPGSYAPLNTSTHGPFGLDYVSDKVLLDYTLFAPSNERREENFGAWLENSPQLGRYPSAGRQIINPFDFTPPDDIGPGGGGVYG